MGNSFNFNQDGVGSKSFKGGASLSADGMFNIFESEWPEFSAYMEKNFGANTFNEGYNIIKENYQETFNNEDDYEKALSEQIRHLDFQDDQDLATFVNNCCTFLTV